MPRLISSATVRLNFVPEDTSPPEFSANIYQHGGISSEEQTLVVSINVVTTLLLLLFLVLLFLLLIEYLSWLLSF